MWAHVLDLLCCQRPRQPKALHPENQEQNSFSFGGSQGSTTPEAPQSSFDGSTASESEEEPTSKVATAMLKHWRHSESFTQAKLVQDLAAKLQLNAKKYEAGSFFTAAKAKEGFFAVIGQEAFLGGLNLRSVSSMGKSSLGKSLELAWFDNKAAYTERRAFAGSISLHQVQGSSVGPPAGSRYANLDEVTRGQMVVICTLGPAGFGQLEVLCESRERAETWSRSLQDLVSMVRRACSHPIVNVPGF
ncbi:unnamed protein product [Effrenium voratum]|nr:unnamed protein product [Effrenium voratum]